jgi:hypothetical protein
MKLRPLYVVVVVMMIYTERPSAEYDSHFDQPTS